MFKYLKHFKQDFPASIVVFLVALPLCLGIAVASGASPFAGIISGVIGGIVIGFLSKSHLSVSGPAAGLVTIVYTAIHDLGYETFLLAVMLAGVIQLLLGLVRAGIIGHFFPSSVIKGMLAAIGLILIMKQVQHMFGYDGDPMGEFSFFQPDGFNTFTGMIRPFQEPVVMGAIIVGFFCLALMILWARPMIQNHKVLGRIPSAVLVVIVGAVINSIFAAVNPELVLGGSHLVNVPEFDGWTDFTDKIKTPNFASLGNSQVYVVAITLALVASLETLLSIEAVDKMDPHKRRTSQNAELRAQGIGNTLSGLIGGLPITAVIVRSTANLESGAQSKLSAVYHGILLLIAVLVFPYVINLIPMASLAAILIMVGYKLTRPSLYKEQFRLGWDRFVPFIVTITAILMTDLLKGVVVGLVVGIFFILRANYKVTLQSDQENEKDGKRDVHIKLSEHVSFLNKAKLQLRLDQIPNGSHVIIDGTHTKDIDYDAVEVIYNFSEVAEERQINLELRDIPEIESYYRK
ncbi:SulP family inorganic anion transporter [Phaeocystidibacter luteus]|uniref:SulP family inorganic anion transporter n=1 Tax=Phaeocystidibacter luteus TaxID=911197 RepID=A0A6N6RFF5_9FLAO|nr:SulP family inorganic anion transporter [Phaeocystidibacter luteus]KAB2805479.1 SulP family inorganic anion transporter [Phaeocystidibacter luteus]